MKLDDVNFIELLPAFMKNDEACIGLSEGVNKVSSRLAERIKLLTTWNQIDKMSSAELDLLAEELHISWYDKLAAIEVKRNIIKQSDMVHAKLGTNWAAMQVINEYFGESKIIDWYEYGGEPGHFKIQTLNQSILNSKANAFMQILEKVKRKSAHLDAIELISDGQCHTYVFITNVESEVVTYTVQR